MVTNSVCLCVYCYWHQVHRGQRMLLRVLQGPAQSPPPVKTTTPPCPAPHSKPLRLRKPCLGAERGKLRFPCSCNTCPGVVRNRLLVDLGAGAQLHGVRPCIFTAGNSIGEKKGFNQSHFRRAQMTSHQNEEI